LVNKTILSMRSDYFNAMFSSGMTEAQSNRISLKASPDAFEIVLRFIYTDECVFQGVFCFIASCTVCAQEETRHLR